MKDFFSLKPRIGISACLLGQKVRYDGGDKRPFSTDTFGLHGLLPCPEQPAGREAVRLVEVAIPNDRRAFQQRLTGAMSLAGRARALKELELRVHFERFTQLRAGTVRVYNQAYPQPGGGGLSPAQS
jgi:uncharacterized protein YbbK (DUF523 family)